MQIHYLKEMKRLEVKSPKRIGWQRQPWILECSCQCTCLLWTKPDMQHSKWMIKTNYFLRPAGCPRAQTFWGKREGSTSTTMDLAHNAAQASHYTQRDRWLTLNRGASLELTALWVWPMTTCPSTNTQLHITGSFTTIQQSIGKLVPNCTRMWRSSLPTVQFGAQSRTPGAGSGTTNTTADGSLTKRPDFTAWLEELPLNNKI